MTTPRSIAVCLLAPTATLALAAGALAESNERAWPQFGGPERNFVAAGAKVAPTWPDGGPKKLWERALGDGYSGIVTDGQTLYTMTRRGDEEVVVALAAATGKDVWEHAYAAPAPSGSDRYGYAPRGTPAIVADRLFTIGYTGRLTALNRKDGKPAWSHDLVAEFGGNIPKWGYSSSPLAHKDTLIVPVGGPGKSVMAFKQSDGKVVWSSGDTKNAYSSPILIDVGGQTQVVMFLADEVVGLDPDSGKQLWSHPHKTNYDVNATLPVWGKDDILFVSSAYKTGSRALKLTRDGDKTAVKELWAEPKIGIQHSSVVRVGDVIYGSVGMMGPAFLVAVDVKTGKELWRERDFGKANVMVAGDKLLLLDENGVMALIKPSSEKLDVLARAEVAEKTSWTAPAVVGSTAYVRDRKNIMALDLK